MLRANEVIDNRYRIVAPIGQGGMSIVYEADDFVGKRSVAIKVLKDELAQDSASLEQFAREAEACASMRHQNIIQVYSKGKVNDCPYLVFEYIKGQGLNDKLDYLRVFQLYEASQIMLQILDAVEYIHNKGIIHRDIKPANIFYNSDGNIKLADFGIAVNAKQASKDANGKVMGSICYLAPELCKGKEATVKSDIYALGVTFFELLTGRLPFEDGHTKDIALAHINKRFPIPSEINSLIPERIDNIILKACAKRTNDRYDHVYQMRNDIVAALLDDKNQKVEKKGLLSKIFGFK